MNILSTKSQQLAVRAAQLLTDLHNQGQEDPERERPLRAFFAACGEEPTLQTEGMFSLYTFSREQVERMGQIPPESLPQVPSLSMDGQSPLAYPAPGMAVARKRLYGGQYDILLVVQEVKPLLVGALLHVGDDWYNQDGTQTTEKGTVKRNPQWLLEPVTPAVGEQLERQNILQELTGHSSAFLNKGVLYQLPLASLQRIKLLVEAEMAQMSQSKEEGEEAGPGAL